MPEPLKNLFNPPMVRLAADHMKRVDNGFDAESFFVDATQNMESLELKERSRQIRDALLRYLSTDFQKACSNMLDALHPETDVNLSNTSIDARGIRGWFIMPMAEVVAKRGLDDFDFSMDVLRQFTKRFTSEFAVRAFFLKDSTRALNHAHEWADDPNYHVRRLASEGSRPRLPWALRLPEFCADPAPLVPLLERLRDDPQEYVRKSVANNLNDIAKDNPDTVARIAGDWMIAASRDRQRLVRHACRTLIKQGHPATLAALGYRPAEICVGPITLKTPQVTLGGALEFGVSVTSRARATQPLIIDYVIHHRKANGETTPKVFKWKVTDLPAGKTLMLGKRHSIRAISTRRYYSGKQFLEIQINGNNFGRVCFDLNA